MHGLEITNLSYKAHHSINLRLRHLHSTHRLTQHCLSIKIFYLEITQVSFTCLHDIIGTLFEAKHICLREQIELHHIIMMMPEVEVYHALWLLSQIDQDKFSFEEHRKQYLLATQHENVGKTSVQLIFLEKSIFGIEMEEDVALSLITEAAKKEVGCIVGKCYSW